MHHIFFLWVTRRAKLLFLTIIRAISEAATGGVLQRAGLKNFAIFTGKHLCWSLFLIKLNIPKFLRTPILKNIREWLLLLYLASCQTSVREFLTTISSKKFNRRWLADKFDIHVRIISLFLRSVTICFHWQISRSKIMSIPYLHV